MRAALKSIAGANAGAQTRKISEDHLAEAVAYAETFLIKHGVPKYARAGVMFLYDPWTQQYKQWGIRGTVLYLTARASGGWDVSASREYCGQTASLLRLYKDGTAAQAGLAVAKTVFGHFDRTASLEAENARLRAELAALKAQPAAEA